MSLAMASTVIDLRSLKRVLFISFTGGSRFGMHIKAVSTTSIVSNVQCRLNCRTQGICNDAILLDDFTNIRQRFVLSYLSYAQNNINFFYYLEFN